MSSLAFFVFLRETRNMGKNLHDFRKSYEKGELLLETVPQNPLSLFETWFQEAVASEVVDEANAMTLSTVDVDGFPRGRVVLLKEYAPEGFVFYTNYGSEKGRAIAKENKVCISFFWPGLERQIIIKGIAEKTSEEQSLAYFNKRPRASQLGALVSEQSERIESREALEAKLNTLEKKFEGVGIPKPLNWGGYRIRPVAYEFWQGRRSRLHDRIVFIKSKEEWKLERLQP